jgi:hypothetical protein
MKKALGRLIPVLLLLCIAEGTRAQVFSNDAGSREKHFIYEVKQIDEFFERFNNDTGSFIRKVYKLYGTRYTADRGKLLKSLFNYETQSWNQSLIANFVRDITAGGKTRQIDFRANGWFAEAHGKFQYNGSFIDIPLILRISTDAAHRSKWVIAAVKSNPLPPDSQPISLTATGYPQRFINPASHANNFIELEKALDDKANLSDYFEPAFFNRKNAQTFYNAVLHNQVHLLYVKDIVYHFLQTGKWLFTVACFPRQTLNSGWLINNLQQLNPAEKNAYLQQLLEE